jgi:hypothetical protein
MTGRRGNVSLDELRTASPLHEIAMMIGISDEPGMLLLPAGSARIRA